MQTASQVASWYVSDEENEAKVTQKQFLADLGKSFMFQTGSSS